VKSLPQQGKCVKELDDRAGPPVRDDEGDGALVVRPCVQEVHPLSRGVGDKRTYRVDLGLDGTPVIAVQPMVDQRLEERLIGAVIPSRSRDFGRPPRVAETMVKVVELSLVHIENE
jgi:hypothetical protein